MPIRESCLVADSNDNSGGKTRSGRGIGGGLGKLPSHRGRRAPMRASFGRPRRRNRPIRNALFLLLGFLIVASVAVIASGALLPGMQRAATDALQANAPPGIRIETGPARIAFDLPASIGVGFDDVLLVDEATDAPMVSIGDLTVTFRAGSLLEGNPRARMLSVSDVVINLPERAPDTPSMLAQIADLDSHKARLASLLTAVNRAAERHMPNGEITLDDIILQRDATERGRIVSGRVITGVGLLASMRLRLATAAGFEDVAMSARASFGNGTDGALDRLTLETGAISLPVGGLLRAFSNDPNDHTPNPEIDRIRTAATIELKTGGKGYDLSASLTPEPVDLRLGRDDLLTLTAKPLLRHDFGDAAISIQPTPVALGRNTFVLSGGLRWRMADPGGLLDLELIANDGILSQQDVAGPKVAFSAIVTSQIDPQVRVMNLSRVEIAAGRARLTGGGQIDFSTQPAISAAHLTAGRMATTTLQRLWPAPIARGARRWVLQNVAGGHVDDVVFDILEPLGRRPGETEREAGDTVVSMQLNGVRFDVAGDIPPVRDASGAIRFEDGQTTISLDEGRLYMRDGLVTDARDGTLQIMPSDTRGFIPARLDVGFSGDSRAIAQLVTLRPIAADRFYAFDPDGLSGQVDGRLTMDFLINAIAEGGGPQWNVDLDVKDFGSDAAIEGRRFSGLTGNVSISRKGAKIDAEGTMDGLPAELSLVLPFPGSDLTPRRDITLELSDAGRNALAPGLKQIMSGDSRVGLSLNQDGRMAVSMDLTSSRLTIPWLNWTKGVGFPAKAKFTLIPDGGTTLIDDFELDGEGFGARGSLRTDADGLLRARLTSVSFNEADDFELVLERRGKGIDIQADGKSFDARTLVRRIRESLGEDGDGDTVPITLNARFDRVAGFDQRSLRNVSLQVKSTNRGLSQASVTGQTGSGLPFSVAIGMDNNVRRTRLDILDAGEFLRFIDLYGQVRGGVLDINLAANGDGPTTGTIRLTGFKVINEPRLDRLVSSNVNNTGNLRGLAGAPINTKEVSFDVASSRVTFLDGSLQLQDAVVRGPLVGLVANGTVYDSDDQMYLTGTFMPAYGLNSLFSEIPVLGQLLGNGRDRGLIGVTFLLTGPTKSPEVIVNPLSVVAPGIFRSIFEFR